MDRQDLETQFRNAVQLHQSQQGQQAAQAYQQILAADPKHIGALHLLGVLYHQAGHSQQGIEYIEKALEIEPGYLDAQINLGHIYKSLGRLEEAKACFLAATKMKPDFLDGHINLGVICKNLGLLSEAEQHYQKAIELKPDAAALHFNLGNVRREAHAFEAALAAYQKACELDGSLAQAHLNVGSLQYQLGRYEEAISAFKKAIELNADYPEAFNGLGLVHTHQKRHADAINAFKHAIELNNNYAKAYSNLGQAYAEVGSIDEAMTALEKAIRLSPDSAELYNNYGNVLRDNNKVAEALDHFQRAAELDPNLAEAHDGLGICYWNLGKEGQAKACFEKAIQLKPDFAEAHYHLSQAHDFRQNASELDDMEQLFQKNDLSVDQKIQLGFGLGKAYEDRQDYERAFDCFAESNRLMRDTYSYSVDDDLALFEAIKGYFDESLLSALQPATVEDDTALFVLGMPRSGTTLVEQILASHSSVFGAGELPYLKKVIRDFEVQTQHKYPALIPHVDNDQWASIAGRYLEQLKGHSNLPFVTDKMPHNFMYIGLIHALMPNAKIVLCQRDPIDTCLSIFKHHFMSSHPYSYDLRELGTYYRGYESLVSFWDRLLPGKIHTVHYESLVQDPEEQIRGLLEYCELPFESACLTHHKTERAVRTASASQVRKPIYADSVQLWKQYEQQLQPLIETLDSQ
ncbi:tetratricopeptide repeat protein [Marinobacteraceae bacterium S3BR75-40.1]